MRLSVSAGFVGLLAYAPLADVAAQDSTIVAVARRVSMSQLDSTYADESFEAWLSTLVGGSSNTIHWEINDCGEGGDGQTGPVCAEAGVTLSSDTTLFISLLVGARDGSAQPPAVWMLFARETGQYRHFTELAEVVAYVHQRRR